MKENYEDLSIFVWICMNCGQFFKFGLSIYEVICDCGTTNVMKMKFKCFHLTHPKFGNCESKKAVKCSSWLQKHKFQNVKNKKVGKFE